MCCFVSDTRVKFYSQMPLTVSLPLVFVIPATSAFSAGTRRYSVAEPFSRCCEIQLEACSVIASIRYEYRQLVFKTLRNT